ncbi:MAG: putative sterol carrier protein [Myxococcota bacterium]|jgi:putative sterol carrier protein
MAFENAAAFFSKLSTSIESDEAAKTRLADLGATYLFSLAGDGGGDFTLDCKSGTVSEAAGEFDCKVGMAARDFLGMINREDGYQGQQLFMMGKLMIEGDMTLALQLEQVMSAAGS